MMASVSTGDTLRLGVMASGRGTNAEAILKAIEAGTIPARVAIVLSDNPQAEVLERAAAFGVTALALDPASFPTMDAFFQAVDAQLDAAGVDLLVLAGFMRLLPARFVRARAGRIMNVHPSLLPAFAGLDAPGQALRYGVRYTGCTVHFVDEGMDTGPIILQAVVPVHPDDTREALIIRIQREEHRIYPEAIRLYAEGRLVVDGRRVHILCRGGSHRD